MLIQPSKRVIQALATLEHDNDFQEVLTWLQASLDSISKDGFYLKDDAQTRWHQGAGQVITEFIDKANTARDVIRKF